MKKETAEQTQRRHQREMRELARLKKSAAKPSLVHGFWFLLVVLTIIYIADEISSNMNGIMRTYTIFDLFKVHMRQDLAHELAAADGDDRRGLRIQPCLHQFRICSCFRSRMWLLCRR